MLAHRVLVAVQLLCVPPLAAQDWPAFRGPHGNGHTRVEGLPLEWEFPTHKNSTPALAEGGIFLRTYQHLG